MNVATLDRVDLENRVKDMYRQVAEEPDSTFHFAMGRALALRLGYLTWDLDVIPVGAVESFAGVGHHFGLANLKAGEFVLDLGSGSGMDTFVASQYVGLQGWVVGVDMTDAQRRKAERLMEWGGFTNISYVGSNIDDLPLGTATFDAVISNGVVNLCEDKEAVFREARRVLKPGGRLCLSDIVTEFQLPSRIVCNASLWAACIGGAMQQDAYREAVERAGFRIEVFRDNPQYTFLSPSARGATDTYRVKSISLRAIAC